MTRILLTLIICVYVALAPAYADDLNTSRKVVLQFVREDGQKVALAEPANRYGGVNMQNMGDRVKIDAVKKYPITVYDPNHPNVKKATLEAAKTATATVAPSAARMAKSLARGVGPIAVSMALTEILGKAVDYVLDPANNAVKYTIKGDITATNLDEFCRLKFIQTYGKDSGGRFHRFESDNPRGSISCINDQGSTIGWFKNPVASMPLSTVAEKIKDMANSGNTSAQSAIRDVVQEMITNNEIDNSYFDSHVTNDTYNDVVNNYITNNYNNVSNVTITQTPTGANVSFNTTGPSTSTSTSSSNTNNNTNTNTNTGADGKDGVDGKDGADGKDGVDGKDAEKFELPAFCDWATVVCDFIEWFKRDDSDKDTDVDIQTPDVKPTSTDIRFSGSCPANVQIPFTFAGNTTTVTVMNWASFCDMIATYLKPLVIALASFAAARILGGVNVND